MWWWRRPSNYIATYAGVVGNHGDVATNRLGLAEPMKTQGIWSVLKADILRSRDMLGDKSTCGKIISFEGTIKGAEHAEDETVL